ncbi:DgyrCDS10496 [Dimorphilus gyrociliatus]|uniref:COMM domain-containing protein 1 n=1 Tax=Dimorphilus gyrociliatus TaxID=2664684 RepID=A0A7I8W1S7_9ANNE|nr:DgyrCDS10496 [Dimorphilus gyrociliatus]
MDDIGEEKKLQGLLNGIFKRDYQGQEEYNDDFLYEQLYQNLDRKEFDDFIRKLRGIVNSMANTNMDQDQAETFLKAQAKKRGGVITSDRVEVVLKFWRNHKEKIHSQIISRTNWNGLTKWKLDINSYSSTKIINQPVAVLQFDTKSDNNQKETLRVEIDGKAMHNVLEQLDNIEDQLQKLGN